MAQQRLHDPEVSAHVVDRAGRCSAEVVEGDAPRDAEGLAVLVEMPHQRDVAHPALPVQLRDEWDARCGEAT